MLDYRFRRDRFRFWIIVTTILDHIATEKKGAGPELQTQDSRSKHFYFFGTLGTAGVEKRNADDADDDDLL